MTGSIVVLLGALAEARDEILNAIADNGAIPRFLFSLIVVPFTPAEVFERVLSCLITFTEDSRDVAQAIVDDQQAAAIPCC